MSETIFILCQDDLGNYEIRKGDKVYHFLWEVAPILNEQQSIIQQLQIDLTDCKNRKEQLEYKIREVVKILTDPKSYADVISIKHMIQYAIKLLKGAIDDE